MASIFTAVKSIYRAILFDILLKKKTITSVEEATANLQSFLHKEPPTFAQINKINPQYDVMIIIPVYNVEKYLEQCIQSILAQETKYTFQAVFVNDGSTDRSGEILKRCIPMPHVFVSTKNQGVAAARNLALQNITGRYVMFLDSDDYLSPNAIEELVNVADEKSADIVEGGHAFFDANGVIEVNTHGNTIHEISHQNLYGFPYGKVIRSNLLKTFCFPQGYIFEDTVMATLLHPSARIIVSDPAIVYNYRDNHSGITHSSKVRKEAIDTFWIMKYCLEERLHRGQVLDQNDYERYLVAVWRNWIRTKALPDDLQKWIFVLTCDLFYENLKFTYRGKQRNKSMLERAIKSRSYQAYCFVLDRWDVL